MDKQDKFAEVIELIYQTVDTPSIWNQVLTGLSTLSDSSHSFLTERRGVNGEPVSFYDEGFSANYFSKYGEYFYQVDIWSQRLATHKPNQFHASHKVCDDTEFLNSEIYSDFAKPEGIRHSIGLFLGDPYSEFTTEMALMRSTGQPHFEKETVAHINRFIPHIQQVQNLSRRLYNLENHNHAVERVVDQLDEAIFLCDIALKIEYCNQQGRSLISKSTLFTCKDDRLRLRNPSNMELLTFYTSQAAGVFDNHNSFIKRHMHIIDKEKVYLITISPWKFMRNVYQSKNSDFGVKISFFPVDSRQLPRHEDIAQMLGLTYAEANVLRLLCIGKTPEYISVFRNTHLSTVRQQIKSCMQKLGVSRQVELVIKVLGKFLI